MFTKLLATAAVGLFSFMGFNISESTPPNIISSPVSVNVTSVEAAPIVSPPPPAQVPQFSRTVETVNWKHTICSNEVTHADYTMHLVSREEIALAVTNAGFTGDSANIATALAYAEGQADLNCQSDFSIANSKWNGSVGLWQIRTLRSETGKGTCRDIDELLKLDINFQARCAFEISGGGTNFKPWAAFTRGLHKKYL
jgi:hypothetical protein